MNIKGLKSIGVAVLCGLVLAACNNSATPENTKVETGVSGTFNADLSTSAVSWKGGMVGGAYFHTGTLSLSEGSVSLENGNITGGNFTVDLKTMKTTDNNYDSVKHTSENLIGHLSTGDFFLVDSFPTATFSITGADSTGVTGDMTIKGITQSEKIENVVITETENGGVSLKGSLTIDRSKYGVNYQSTAKDMVLSDDIELEFEVVAAP